MNPNSAYQLAAQGQQAMQAGMYEQAAHFYGQALQHAPQSDALHYHYASACAWRGLPYDALASLERCMALRGPWFNHASQLSAQIRVQMGLPPAAAVAQPMLPPTMATPPAGMPVAGMGMGMNTPPNPGGMGMGMNTPPNPGGMGMGMNTANQSPTGMTNPNVQKKDKKKGKFWGAAVKVIGAGAIGGIKALT